MFWQNNVVASIIIITPLSLSLYSTSFLDDCGRFKGLNAHSFHLDRSCWLNWPFYRESNPFSATIQQCGNRERVNPPSLSLGPTAPWDNRFRGFITSERCRAPQWHSYPAGSWHQPLTCLNSWNVWQDPSPEIWRATGKGVERKEEREAFEEGRHGGRTGGRGS